MTTQDSCQRFICTEQHWRGEIVRLHDSYQTIMRQHGYPLPIQQLLGQALVAVTLLSSMLKYEGQLTLQFQSEEGAVEMLVAKCNHLRQIRGLAQWQHEASLEELVQGLHDGRLALTLEQANAEPYQSIVPMQRGTIAQALQNYFSHSEQLPTMLQFAVDAENAVGVLLQKLPESAAASSETSDWVALRQRFEPLKATQLLGNSNAEIIQTLQERQDVHLYSEHEVQFFCPCSVERMERALLVMGNDDVMQTLEDKQEVEVTCEYCNHSYGFSRDEVERIFSDAP